MSPLAVLACFLIGVGGALVCVLVAAAGNALVEEIEARGRR